METKTCRGYKYTKPPPPTSPTSPFSPPTQNRPKRGGIQPPIHLLLLSLSLRGSAMVEKASAVARKLDVSVGRCSTSPYGSGGLPSPTSLLDRAALHAPRRAACGGTATRAGRARHPGGARGAGGGGGAKPRCPPSPSRRRRRRRPRGRHHHPARAEAGGLGARVQRAVRHQPVWLRRRGGVPGGGVPGVLRPLPAAARRQGHLHVQRGARLLQHGVPLPRHRQRRVPTGEGPEAPRRRRRRPEGYPQQGLRRPINRGGGDRRIAVLRRRPDLLHHRNRSRLISRKKGKTPRL